MERPADVIERLRAERGLTQAQACSLGGLPQATWSAAETGCSRNPRPRTKTRIARALGVTPSSIWPTRPRPLHLQDVEDPRWAAAVRRMAQRLDREGSFERRRRFGRHLVQVLDYADRGSCLPELDDGRWDEFWRLAGSLTLDPQSTAIAIVDGRLVERDLEAVTADTRMRVVAAKGRRSKERRTASRSRPAA
jgi:lambda repressor-like predicted transcriptional regulator